jgi:hypothetical protein
MDVEALRLLHTQRDALKRLPNPDDADMKGDKYEAAVRKQWRTHRKLLSKFPHMLKRLETS